MAVNVEWFDRSRGIVYFSFLGSWTIGELLAELDDLQHMLDNAPRPIAAVVDFEGSDRFPANTLINLPRIGKHPASSHDNLEMMVVANASEGNGPLVKRLVKQFVRYHQVEDTADALALITQERERYFV